MHSKELFSEYEANVRSYSRSFPEIFTKAKGAKMYDENGKEYIDFFAGAGALNYGHNNDYIKEKVIDYIQSDGIMHSLDMMTAPKAEFIEFFEKKVLEPRGLDYKIMFAGPTGTNAVESLLKLARKVKKREMIWAYMGCFHGMTLGSISLTSDAASRAGAGVGLDNVYHIPAPYMFPELDTIKFMQTLLDDDHSGVEKPAAIFIETVQADGGVNVFSVSTSRHSVSSVIRTTSLWLLMTYRLVVQEQVHSSHLREQESSLICSHFQSQSADTHSQWDLQCSSRSMISGSRVSIRVHSVEYSSQW